MDAWRSSPDRSTVAAVGTAADLVGTAATVLAHELDRPALDPYLVSRMRALLEEAQWLASDLVGLAEVADAAEYAATA